MAGARTRAPWHLWVVGVIAVLFNAIGVFDFVMGMAKGAEYMASSGMTPAQIAHYEAMPGWTMLVWATGVFSAFLASILLLLRKRSAYPVFVLSLAAFGLNLFYTYVLSDGGAVMGRSMMIANVVIAGLLVFFALYARSMIGRRVIGQPPS